MQLIISNICIILYFDLNKAIFLFYISGSLVARGTQVEAIYPNALPFSRSMLLFLLNVEYGNLRTYLFKNKIMRFLKYIIKEKF